MGRFTGPGEQSSLLNEVKAKVQKKHKYREFYCIIRYCLRTCFIYFIYFIYLEEWQSHSTIERSSIFAAPQEREDLLCQEKSFAFF